MWEGNRKKQLILLFLGTVTLFFCIITTQHTCQITGFELKEETSIKDEDLTLDTKTTDHLLITLYTECDQELLLYLQLVRGLRSEGHVAFNTQPIQVYLNDELLTSNEYSIRFDQDDFENPSSTLNVEVAGLNIKNKRYKIAFDLIRQDEKYVVVDDSSIQLLIDDNTVNESNRFSYGIGK